MLRAMIRMFGSRMVVLLASPRNVARARPSHAPVCLPHGSGLDALVLELTAGSVLQLRSNVAPDTIQRLG